VDRFNPSPSGTIATRNATVGDAVFVVVFTSSPTKIANAVIASVPVSVAALHSYWFFSNKRNGNKGVNGDGLSKSVLPQIDEWVSRNDVFSGSEDLLWYANKPGTSSTTKDFSVKRFDPAKIADSVITFISNNVFPCFFHDLMVTDLGVICQA